MTAMFCILSSFASLYETKSTVWLTSTTYCGESGEIAGPFSVIYVVSDLWCKHIYLFISLFINYKYIYFFLMFIPNGRLLQVYSALIGYNNFNC